MPYETREEAITSGQDVEYNGYAHAFAGMGVQFILFMGLDVGIALLTLRQSGLWQRLRAAPLSRTMLLGSRTVSASLIAGFILLVLFSFARVVFGVRILGSFAGFVGVCAAFSLMTAAFGLMVAALGETVEATRGYSIMATLIMVMLGGAWVPTFVFPTWLTETDRGRSHPVGDGWAGRHDVARLGILLGACAHRRLAALRAVVWGGGGDAVPLAGRGLAGRKPERIPRNPRGRPWKLRTDRAAKSSRPWAPAL